MKLENDKWKEIIRALLFVASEPMSIQSLQSLFKDSEEVSTLQIKSILDELAEESQGSSVRLKKVASGFCYQVTDDYAQWVTRLWDEKPPRYSRATLETLSIIAYRQPITRAEIEAIRGVPVSSHIMRSLTERGWIKSLGHKDVLGKPCLYGTSKAFLDYFNLTSLEELPMLPEPHPLENIENDLIN